MNAYNQIINNLSRLDVKIKDKDKTCILLYSLPSFYEYLVISLTYGRDLISLEAI